MGPALMCECLQLLISGLLYINRNITNTCLSHILLGHVITLRFVSLCYLQLAIISEHDLQFFHDDDKPLLVYISYSYINLIVFVSFSQNYFFFASHDVDEWAGIVMCLPYFVYDFISILPRLGAGTVQHSADSYSDLLATAKTDKAVGATADPQAA